MAIPKTYEPKGGSFIKPNQIEKQLHFIVLDKAWAFVAWKNRKSIKLDGTNPASKAIADAYQEVDQYGNDTSTFTAIYKIYNWDTGEIQQMEVPQSSIFEAISDKEDDPMFDAEGSLKFLLRIKKDRVENRNSYQVDYLPTAITEEKWAEIRKAEEESKTDIHAGIGNPAEYDEYGNYVGAAGQPQVQNPEVDTTPPAVRSGEQLSPDDLPF